MKSLLGSRRISRKSSQKFAKQIRLSFKIWSHLFTWATPIATEVNGCERSEDPVVTVKSLVHTWSNLFTLVFFLIQIYSVNSNTSKLGLCWLVICFGAPKQATKREIGRLHMCDLLAWWPTDLKMRENEDWRVSSRFWEIRMTEEGNPCKSCWIPSPVNVEPTIAISTQFLAWLAVLILYNISGKEK